VKVSKNAPASPTHVADSVVEKMKKISQDYPVLKWQYFASEQGVLSSFPALEDTADCGSYDPRFRPFYVETATPEPKDVVLVIDHSGSMSGSRMIVAKEAAKTVLRTMNPRDRVSIFQPSDRTCADVGQNTRLTERSAFARTAGSIIKTYFEGHINSEIV